MRLTCKQQFAFYLIIALLLAPFSAFAQVDSPNASSLFRKDNPRYQSQLKKKKKEILNVGKVKKQDVKIKTPRLQFSDKKNTLRLKDGFVLGKGNLQLQADQGRYNIEDQSVSLKDNVFLSFGTGTISAEKAKVYLENETGEFNEATLNIEESDFLINATNLKKISEFDYIIEEPELSPCSCVDGTTPWSISCSEITVREEGYAVAEDFAFKAYDKTLVYLPKLAFPAKRVRQSGVLFPKIGYNNRNGVLLSLPYFYNLNESTDLIFNPFVETNTRLGSSLDYNQVYSDKSSVESRFYYSNESARDGNLRGTQTQDLFDPAFDENRFAAYLKQSWRNDSDSSVPVSILSDIHYISDDLILREFNDNDLGLYNSRFATSRIVARANFHPLLSAELSGEYNQAILQDDDLIFQRAPELNLRSYKTARILGQKFVFSNNVQGVNFSRSQGYEGNRLNVNPEVKMPFNYKNYFSGSLAAEGNFTRYSVDDEPDQQFADSRDVIQFSAEIGTELEKISDVDQNSSLATLTSLGRKNKGQKLTRVKQTFEPKITYNHVPEEEQDNLPLFDSIDRIRERQLLGWNLRTSLFGKFEPVNLTGDKIPELAPEIESLPSVGGLRTLETGDGNPLRTNQIKELASLSVYQNYDFSVDNEDEANGREALSDLGSAITFYPNNNFAVAFESNLDVEDQDLSSYGVRTHFYDDRGDSFVARYSYIENNISQLEGNLEVVLNERLKLAYYTRYDESSGTFIDSQFAFRISSDCNCWDLDIGFRDRINPDNQDFIATLTLKGLGALAQNFSLLSDQELEGSSLQ